MHAFDEGEYASFLRGRHENRVRLQWLRELPRRGEKGMIAYRFECGLRGESVERGLGSESRMLAQRGSNLWS